MDNFLIIVLVVVVAILVVKWTQKPKTARQRRIELEAKRRQRKGTILEATKKEFREFKVFEKFGQVLICDIDNIRKEPDEIVFIRFDIHKPKSFEVKGRFMIASYPYTPTGKEMRKDFAPVLFRYK